MAKYIVRSRLLNIRSLHVDDLSEKGNVIGQVTEGHQIESVDEKQTATGMWIKDVDGHWYWCGGLEREAELGNIKDFYQLKMTEQYELAQACADVMAERLKVEYPEITGIFAGSKSQGNKRLDRVSVIIQVPRKNEAANLLPEFLLFNGYQIETDVQQADFAKPLSTSIASGISRQYDSDYGTLGIPVYKDDKLFFLSCYHVYCGKEIENSQYKVDSEKDCVDEPFLISPSYQERGNTESKIVGKVAEGVLSEYLDIAIMKPECEISKNYANMPGPFYYRTLLREHENKIYLRFKGGGSKQKREGKLINILTNQFINYTGKPQHYLKRLIQIERCAEAGDSGSAVCDLNGNFVGYVVASDDNFTYLISAYTIADRTNYKFEPTL